jgi:hypothetical protein
MSAELVPRDGAARKAHVGPMTRPHSRRMSALRMHRHSLPHRLPLWLSLSLWLPHRSLRPDRLNSRPDLRPGWTMLCGTMLGRTISSPMVWLLGVRRKGKRQRNQWKDDPRSVGSVHSCTPLSDVAVIGNRLGLFSVVVFAPIDGAGNIADRPLAVCLVTNR